MLSASRRNPASLISLFVGLAAGLAGGIGVAVARNTSPKYYLPAFAALAVALTLLAAGRYAERICLWGFLLTAPLPMHAFVKQLEPVHGGGALGIYALAPDFFLFLLYGFWISSKADGPDRQRSWRMLLALAPFLFLATLSLAYAVDRFWAFCEWLRWLKVLLILIYATRRLKLSEVEPCLRVLAVSASLEGILGMLQAVTKSLLGLDKLGVFGSGARYDLTMEISGGVPLFRGSGLTGHPNLFASYLLLLLPLLLLRASTATGKAKSFWFAALALSCGGLLSTMSRAAWACFLAATALAWVAAVAYKLITLRRAFQWGLAFLLVALALVLPFRKTIRGRFEADFSDSWKIRRDLSQTAIEIAGDHPIFGVGLNSYTILYPQYDPNLANEQLIASNMITVVHNVYLLVLAEMGAVGLTAYLLFYFAVFVFGLRGLRARGAPARAVIIGLLAGLLAAMVCDLTEFDLWIELCMYTIAFFTGIIDCLNPRLPARRPGSRQETAAVVPEGVGMMR